jgi:hypothetical protein
MPRKGSPLFTEKVDLLHLLHTTYYATPDLQLLGLECLTTKFKSPTIYPAFLGVSEYEIRGWEIIR